MSTVDPFIFEIELIVIVVMLIGLIDTRADIGGKVAGIGAQREAEDIGKVSIITEVFAEIVDDRVEDQIDYLDNLSKGVTKSHKIRLFYVIIIKIDMKTNISY